MSARNMLPAMLGLGFAVLVAACASPTPTAPPPTSAPTSAPATAPTMASMPTTVAPMPTMETMKPNCASGKCDQPGPAITQNLKGDLTAGEKVYADSCQKCHGPQGQGGVPNPGSTDGTIPSLNPVDENMGKGNPKLFATTLDLFIEHGSTPDGPNPKEVMDAWGDQGKLTPQQIADVIAYIMSLNQ